MTVNTDPAKGWVRLADIPAPKYPPFLVENLIHEGPTVLYGRPKAGKTTLALTFAASAMSGEPWLGYNVRECRKVAFWGLDPVQTAETKRWADTIQGLDDMLFCSMPPVQDPSMWDAEARQLASLGVGYVVVDNLTRLMPPGKSVREDEAVNPVLANIDVLINSHDMGVLLIHHSGKPGEDGNPRKTPLGCTSIEAWGRHFLRVEVEHTKTGATNRTLYSYGNSLPMAELKIPFCVVDKGIAIDETRDFDVVNKRMTFILENQPWQSQVAIAEALGISQPTVQRTLKKCGYKLEYGHLVPLDS